MLNWYKPGDWNAICDRCGFKYKASMLKQEWQGLMTCPTCYETKHPSLFQIVHADRLDVPWARPQPTDTFVTLPTITPDPAPDPGAGASAPTIAVAAEPTDVLEVGNHIEHENIWNAVGLTRGTYVGLAGTTYEQYIGAHYPTPTGSGDPVGMRMSWKFPTGTTEVKSYPSIITGNFPGWFTNSVNIAGTWPLRKEDGTYNTVSPTGPTPNSTFPYAIPMASALHADFKYALNEVPTGRGHLSFDIWIQDSAPQTHGFTVPPITHEIMIPIHYWGTPGYGSYPNGRNPSWYSHDDTIDGMLFHIYYAPGFNGAWQFIVFEPDEATTFVTQFAENTAISLNLQSFINYVNTQGWFAVPNPISGNSGTHMVSVELGVECVDGTGDLTIYDYQIS